MKRVVITGQGTINPLGNSVPQTFDAMREGRSAIGALDVKDAARLHIKIGAQVKGFDPAKQFSEKEIALMDRFSQFAMVAAREAIEGAALEAAAIDAERVGVVLGSASGGFQTSEDAYRRVFEDQASRVHPFTVPRLMSNAAASHIAIQYGFLGASLTVSNACASANQAIGLAVQTIRAGGADIVLTGGAEAMVSFGGIKAWEGLRVLSGDGCRPFCGTRNGMVLGEGAAIFVLEELEHARRRNAPIIAEVIGIGAGSDAHDIVAPSSAGAQRVMKATLADAGIGADAVTYINAHGSGTRANDAAEAEAIRRVFGTAPDAPFVSSTKSMHGHLIGAAGAVELLACTLAIGQGVIAPNIGYCAPDPECDLNIVSEAALCTDVEVAMSNAFAFGGSNASIILRRV